MKNKTLKTSAIILAAIGTLTFNACKKEPQPAPVVEQEEFDAARIHYILLNDDGSETRDTVTVNFDKAGHPSPHHVHVDAGHQYRSLITLFYKGNPINDEITDEGEEHQFFFIASQPGLVEDFEYRDLDKNGRGIGLDGIITFSDQEGTADLKIVLRHGLNKSHESAQAWNSPDYQNAGGTDDLNIAFEIHVTDAEHGHDDH